MFDQSQTLTVNAVAKALPLITFDGLQSERFLRDTNGDELKLRIAHERTKAGVDRSVTGFTRTKYVDVTGSGGAVTKVAKPWTINISLVRPADGTFTETDLVNDAAALVAWLTAGSNANLKRVLGLES